MISQEEKINPTQSLTLEERRRQLAEQAELAAAHYELSSAQEERAEWQGGDVFEY